MVGDSPREHNPGATGLSKDDTATDATIYLLSPVSKRTKGIMGINASSGPRRS
jgi:hypothetical protein